MKATPPSRFSRGLPRESAAPDLHNREPSAEHYAVRGAWLCHTGKVRRGNEDACLVGTHFSGESSGEPAAIEIPAAPWIVAVSDGIGGHRGGAEASQEVVRALAVCPLVTPHSVTDLLQHVNRRLCERGQTESELAAMGATVAGIGCGARGLFAFNVGDSRVYRFDGQRLSQITRDDSEAEDLIDQGLLTRNDGARPGFLHALTQAIGGREEVVEIETHIHPLRIAERTRFIICSDGLTDMLTPGEIERILRAEPRAAEAARLLFERAMEAGGVDNITLAVLDLEPA